MNHPLPAFNNRVSVKMGGGTSRRRVVEEDLGGCVAVVTGASSGLGRAVAFRLAVMGAHTILACRDRSRTDEVGVVTSWQKTGALSGKMRRVQFH